MNPSEQSQAPSERVKRGGSVEMCSGGKEHRANAGAHCGGTFKVARSSQPAEPLSARGPFNAINAMVRTSQLKYILIGLAFAHHPSSSSDAAPISAHPPARTNLNCSNTLTNRRGDAPSNPSMLRPTAASFKRSYKKTSVKMAGIARKLKEISHWFGKGRNINRTKTDYPDVDGRLNLKTKLLEWRELKAR
jgi:hypothetical protein